MNAPLDRLASIAENFYREPGKRFEDGVAQAMIPVLASTTVPVPRGRGGGNWTRVPPHPGPLPGERDAGRLAANSRVSEFAMANLRVPLSPREGPG